jgi:uncharacterized protein (TIGR00290 family)
MKDVIISWSGGKDCAMALHAVLEGGGHNVISLLTTLTEDYDRISMHGVRRELLEQQTKAMGLPLTKIFIPQKCTDRLYEELMGAEMARWKERGVTGVVFADIFLEDIRKFREDKLAQASMEALFPLWKRPTDELAEEFIALGFKSIITCVDSKALDKKFAGRIFDHEFLADLPPGVDPCGENGEFHSFVFDGPVFKSPVKFERGEVVRREERFYFCDLK